MKQHFLYTEGGGFKPSKFKTEPDFLIIDLFCGAGGTTIGFENARRNGNEIAKVIACVNHDPKAIESHWKNHPEVIHFEEDIRTLELGPLQALVEAYRVLYPNAKVILWASLECTNFSKAKGGQPRDADSRTLADHLPRYITAINPDYVQIENVVEFMSWGPLRIARKKLHKENLAKGIYAHSELKTGINKITGVREYLWIPESKKNGKDFVRWCNLIDKMGYSNKWKELNSADYGAYTSRNRLFGCFAKPELSIVWPEATHSKKAQKEDLFGSGLKKWKAVKEVLDLEDEGLSIFNRKKPLVDASLERIEAGLIKFVAGGKDAFLLKYNSMASNGDKKHCVVDIEKPANTISCQVRTNLCFISKYYSGKPEGKVIGIDGPAGTIRTKDGQYLVSAQPYIMNTNFKNVGSSIDHPAQTLTASRRHPYLLSPQFIASYYGNGDNIRSVEEPAPTIPTKDRCSLINPAFINREYKTATNSSIDEPIGALLTVPKANLVTCDPFILNPSHGGHWSGTDVPCVTIVARQDKAPLYLIQYSVDKNIVIPIYESDSEVMIRIKKFMALYGLSDIKMRMLKVLELLPIQGFPKDYILCGNQTDQKKFIGNSVVPHVVTAWCETMATELKLSLN